MGSDKCPQCCLELRSELVEKLHQLANALTPPLLVSVRLPCDEHQTMVVGVTAAKRVMDEMFALLEGRGSSSLEIG